MRLTVLLAVLLTLLSVPLLAEGRVVLTVNGKTLTNEALERRVRILKRKYEKKGEPTPDREAMRETVLDRTIRNFALQTRADSVGITVRRREAIRAFESFRSRLPEKRYRQALKKIETDRAELIESFKEGIMVQRLFRRAVDPVSVSDTEARTYYENNRDQFGNRSFEGIRQYARKGARREKRRRARLEYAKTVRSEADVSVQYHKK